MQNARRLERNDHGGDDEQHDGQPDEPHIELVAEQVVGGGGDHGALQRVKGRGGQRHGHDEHDADDPRGELLEQQEEGHAAVLGGISGPRARPGGDATRHADEGEDNEDGDAGDGDANPQVAVGLGGEGAQPKVGEEEVVGQDRDGEDVQELPAEEVWLGEPGGLDERWVDVRPRTDSNGRDEDETKHHGTLDVVCQEGDLETTQS